MRQFTDKLLNIMRKRKMHPTILTTDTNITKKKVDPPLLGIIIELGAGDPALAVYTHRLNINKWRI